MLRLAHARFKTICYWQHQALQCLQGAAACISQNRLPHPTANTGVKHPLGNLQCRRTVQLSEYTAPNQTPRPPSLRLDTHRPSIPGVPLVLHFTNDAFMGVLYPGCTTPSGHTPRWATDHRHRRHGNTRSKTGYGELESKPRFPLPHTLDGGYLNSKEAALN